jgi:3-phosphoshikimate 1-carboxyvinyltransferase
MERSSQFASACLIAAAGALYRKKISAYELVLEGMQKSVSYLELTLAFLEKIGIRVERRENSLTLSLVERKNRFVFAIEKDASSLAFLEVVSTRLQSDSWFHAQSQQGDRILPALLKKVDERQPISLRHTPDLAPPLWAYAAITKGSLEIVESPHLRLKESDRTALLLQAAELMGAKGEITADGLKIDFQFRRVHPREAIFLPTNGDHRLAMAYGTLGFFEPGWEPDRKDCVKKSFPLFWQALQLFREAIPG